MVTAVQNIERHFRIPSKLSGLLVSARKISQNSQADLIIRYSQYKIHLYLRDVLKILVAIGREGCLSDTLLMIKRKFQP